MNLGAPGLDFETWETTNSRNRIIVSETWYRVFVIS